MLRGIRDNSRELNGAAELDQLSGTMTDSSGNVLDQVQQSAGTADVLSQDRRSVAQVIGDSTDNINGVTAAIEQLSTMIGG